MNKETLRTWRDLLETKAVFELLRVEIEIIKKAWQEGQYLKDEIFNAKQVGVIEGINKILFMEIEDEE